MLYNNLEAWKWQLGFQKSTTAICDGIHEIYNYVFIYLIFVFFFFYMVLRLILKRFYLDLMRRGHRQSREDQLYLYHRVSILKLTHNSFLEFIWTFIPVIILSVIATPSFVLLYSMDEIIEPSITLKIIGHQWYWEYDYINIWGDVKNYESWMIPESDLEKGELRLLEVDKAPTLPADTHIRLLITSADVIHSWTIPSVGVKIDAVPGRLNQGTIFFHVTGIHYGQCSEICGVNHGFMPIKIISTL